MSGSNEHTTTKQWTGRDIGRLYLTKALSAYNNTDNSKSSTELIDANKISDIVKNFDENNIQQYSSFLAIHNWINSTKHMCTSQEQQALKTLNRLLSYLDNLILYEKITDYLHKIPTVITKTQFNKLDKEYRNNIFYKETGIFSEVEPIKVNVYYLIYNVLIYYRNLNSKKRSANPLIKMEEYLNNPISTLYFQDKFRHLEETALHYSSLPSKAELINSPNFYDLFREVFFAKKNPFFSALNEEFSELIDYLFKDILKNHKKLSFIKKINKNEWHDNIINTELLFDINFYEFCSYQFILDKEKLSSFENFTKNTAVIPDNSDFSNKKLTFIEPDAKTILPAIGENIFSLNEDKAKNSLQHWQNLFFDCLYIYKKSVYFLIGYNKVIELIDECFDIKDVLNLKSPIEAFVHNNKTLNSKISELKDLILKSNNNADAKKKIGVIDKLIQPVNFSDFKISKTKANSTKKNIDNFTAFYEENLNPLHTLCDYDEVN